MAGGSGISGGPASDPFRDTLALLTDPVKLQAEYDRIAAARAGAQAVVDLAGPASEIVQIREQLGQAQAELSALIEAAKEQAKQIVAQGQADADAARSQGALDAAAMKASAQQIVDAATEVERKAFETRDYFNNLATNLTARDAMLTQRQADADAREKDLTAREAALAAKSLALEATQVHLANTIATLAG